MRFWDELFPEWELSQAVRGEWEITNTVDGKDPYKTTEFVVYEIYYSKKLKKYKFEMIGYKPKQHSIYPEIVQWIAEQNKLNPFDHDVTIPALMLVVGSILSLFIIISLSIKYLP